MDNSGARARDGLIPLSAGARLSMGCPFSAAATAAAACSLPRSNTRCNSSLAVSLSPSCLEPTLSVVDVGADVVAEEQEWSGAYPANYAQKFEGPGHINTRGRGFKTWDTAGEIKTRDQAVTATSILFAVILVVLRQVYITTEPTPEPTIKRTQSTISFASK
eukprot:gene23462-14541_t